MLSAPLLSLTFALAPPSIFVAAPAAHDTMAPSALSAVSAVVEAEARRALGDTRVVTSDAIKSTLATAADLACLGSDELSASCASEIGDALGVDYILTTRVSQIGDLYVVSVGLLKGGSGTVAAQEARRVERDDAGGLLDETQAATFAALGPLDPIPMTGPAPGAALPIVPLAAISTGALLVVAAAATQIFAVSTFHVPYAAGDATREEARAWESSAVLWHGGAVLGYATGVAVIGFGVSQW